MEEKVVKDFTITPRKMKRSNRYLKFLAVFGAVLCMSWSSEQTDAPIAMAIFQDIILPLNLPENFKLRSTRNAIEIDSDGVRGIIVYCQEEGVYLAYERNCSYHPNDACATVNIDGSRLFLTDPCCKSFFSLDDGFPTGGPAWRPLRKYRTIYNESNTTLTITSEIEREP